MYTERVFVISLLLTTVGLYFTLRTSFGWVGALVRKFRRGVPYMWGSAERAFLVLVPACLLLASGILLGAAGLGLRRFQPISDMVQVGNLELRKGGGGEISFHFRPVAGYPAPPIEPSGATPRGRWSLSGQFILWKPFLHHLGLHDSHRLAWFLAVSDRSEIPSPDSITRRALLPARPGRMWRVLTSFPFSLPFVEIREFQSPWESGTPQEIELFAYPGGYLFVHPDPGRPILD